MFKPLLAATCEDVSALKWPLLASPKLDGIRAMVISGVLVSRTMKPIPNDHVRGMFSLPEFEGFDGELISGDPTDPKAFNVSTGDVMRKTGTPDVNFWVFDRIAEGKGFQDRHEDLADQVVGLGGGSVKVVPHRVIIDADAFGQYEEQMVGLGYEGVMLRDPNGAYKYGRSTLREQTLMKVKRFTDDEATILSVIEGQHNANEAKKDAFGRTERSSAKAGQVPNGLLGALQVRNTAGQEFKIGTGFDAKDHKELWEQREQIVGKTIKYRYQKAGMKDLPRFPSYIGFRED